MSSSTAKRLILYRFDRQPAEAFVHADTYLQPSGIELLFPDGSVQVIDYISIKALCFAAEGAPADLFLAQTSFERRPKTPGLWTSFRLRDDDVLQGVLPHNVLEWPLHGYFLTPPKANSFRQRVFLPRLAIRETALLGLIGKAASLDTPKPALKKLPAAERQLEMFE